MVEGHKEDVFRPRTQQDLILERHCHQVIELCMGKAEQRSHYIFHHITHQREPFITIMLIKIQYLYINEKIIQYKREFHKYWFVYWEYREFCRKFSLGKYARVAPIKIKQTICYQNIQENDNVSLTLVLVFTLSILAWLSLMMEAWASRSNTVLRAFLEYSSCGLNSSSRNFLLNMVVMISFITTTTQTQRQSCSESKAILCKHEAGNKTNTMQSVL